MFKLIDGPVPQISDMLKMWEIINISERNDVPQSLQRYIDALKEVYLNGDVVYKQFFIPEDSIFDWYASRNCFHKIGFFEKFWKTASVKKQLPYKIADLNFYDETIFKWSSPFMLGGSMAWALSSGGAYKRHATGSVDAKKIADNAASSLINDQYDEILVFESHSAWSDFYMDVAWDRCWVVIDKTKRLVHVLMATDTD